MTELDRALDRISEIHRHLAQTEVYRGFRSVPIALSGVVGLAGGALQSRFVEDPTGWSFVVYWAGVAAVALVVSLSGVAINYWKTEESSLRRRTLIVAGQFLPSLAAGLLLTIALYTREITWVPILPGIWAILFSLGIFAARLYLPKNIGWLALGYLVAGCVLLLLAPGGRSLSPWGMGLVFGVGQITSALILYWDLERKQPNAE
jgi:hypothetical protein